MTIRRAAQESLEPRALEAHTQAIGRELFAAATREHAHLSVLNRWTAQVLTWCLADPSLNPAPGPGSPSGGVKSSVLRFIDVLPSLRTPREITRHLREYFPSRDMRLPTALRLGARLARPGLLTQGAVAVAIRQLVEQVGRQFIVAARPEEASRVVQTLAARGMTCSLDVLGEQVLSDADAERYVTQCARLLRSCGPQANLSVKPSALTPRFDPVSPSQSIAQAAQRLQPLLELARTRGVLLNLDMEQYEYRDLTLALAKHVLTRDPTAPPAQLGVVLQAYLRDADDAAEDLLAWLAAHHRTLTVRLVKGAYWDYEVAHATQRHWPSPVYQDKADADAAFERLTRRLLSAHPLVMTAIASHNVRSIAQAMAVADALGLAKSQVEFQFLYGMGEALHAAVASMGYPVRIYAPIGELIPGMAYLVRRLLENTANESFLRQDLVHERSAEELLVPPRIRPETAAPGTVVPSLADGWSGEPFLDFAQEQTRRQVTAALTAVKTQLGRSYPVLLGAESVRTPETFASYNPSHPTEVVGHVCRAGAVEVERAVQLAAVAQPAWGRTPVSERAQCLRRAAALLRSRRDELVAWEAFEVGKTRREADADVLEAIEFLEYYAWCMVELSRGRPVLQLPGERNLYRYVPRGVAVVIAPWNFPAAILTGMASAALVAGNAVILKPAGPSSVIAAHIARMLREAGVPPGIVQLLPGSGDTVGAALVRHPGTQVVLFTGSKAVGLSIIEACGRVASGQRFVKHVVTEMGGKNAIVIDADADLDAALAGTLRSAFGYGGQKCSAASRVIAHEAVYDRFLQRLAASTDRLIVGDPVDPNTDLGPLIDEAAQRRLQQAIDHARQAATVAYAYPSSRLPVEGFFVPPTIVTNVPSQDALAREELFGPLLCVFRVKTFAEALTLANDTDYALTGGVYSRSPSHLEQAIGAFDVGNLYLNRPITGAMVGRQPFGGHRLSGLGTKAGGPDYLLHLLLPKTICMDTTRHGMPLE